MLIRDYFMLSQRIPMVDFRLPYNINIIPGKASEALLENHSKLLVGAPSSPCRHFLRC